MRRVELGSDVVLYHGDCLTILPTLEAGSVDVIITDPPYGTKTDQRTEWMIGEFANVMPLTLPLLHAVAVSNAAFYCFTSWSHMADWLLRYQMYFKLRNILIWDKGRHSGLYTRDSWQFTWEGIFYGIKGRRDIRKYQPDVLRSRERGKRLPMQKPVDVICCLIEASSDYGHIVLDPFMGRGTTGVACVQTGRKFIGIEINQEYFNVAQQRIEAAMMQQRLPLEMTK